MAAGELHGCATVSGRLVLEAGEGREGSDLMPWGFQPIEGDFMEASSSFPQLKRPKPAHQEAPVESGAGS